MTVYNINIIELINNLEKLKEKGYKYFDLEIKEKGLNSKKPSNALHFYPLEPINKRVVKPRKKLGIEELIKYHT